MKAIDRRKFLRLLGAGAAVSGVALAGCGKSQRGKGGSVDNVPFDKMTYRTNQHSGDKVSLLGFGCMRWPMRKNAKGEEVIDQDGVNALVDYAIAHGVNYFDTAPVYVRGWSETATGIALKRHPRDKFFIATKLSNQRDDPKVRSREGSIALYRKSLVELQVDYIDYYLLHSVGSGGFEAFKNRFIDNGMIEFLLQEKAAGRIRNLGWSYHGDVEAVTYLLKMGIQWDFAMIQLNYVDWKNATRDMVSSEYLYNELAKHHIPTVIMEPLLGGRLWRLPAHSLEQLKQLRPEDSPASWAFRYAGSPENVLTVLSGMTLLEHLQENIQTYSPLVPLAEPEYKALEQVTELMLRSDFIPCTTCQYCMPCPYGIDIPSTFAHYNDCVNDELLPKGTRDENYSKARRAFLVGYDNRVPKLRQASHCMGCDKCVPKCPQKIKISEEMRRIDAFIERLKREALYAVPTSMQALVDTLHEGHYSCVIANNGEVRTFSKHGIADLMGLLRGSDAEFLKGASIADKVIGKAAAVFLVLGGVKEIYGDVMSDTAIEFLLGKPVSVSFGECVPHIQNVTRTGWCPMDSLVRRESNPERMKEMLEKFVIQAAAK